MRPDDERTARRIERRVVRFIEEHSLFGGGETVLLAVSGGPDSLALLHIVSRIRARCGITPVAAYVDHGLRPADQIAAERAFVEAEARGLAIAFVTAATPAEQSGGRRRSPEDAARRGRYTALARLAADVGAAAVATGHTRTDQAETVLLRLIGGAGLRGLAAMAPVAGWPVPAAAAPRLVRPLLCLSRRETVDYCAALRLAPRSDPENRNRRYLRNRLRADVLPALASLNPRIEFVLTDLAEEAQAWRAAAEATLPRPAHATDASGVETWSLEVGLLRSMEQPLRMMTLRAALAAALPADARVGRAHLLALERLAGGPRGRAVALPAGAWAWREADALLIARAQPSTPSPLGADRAVPVPGSLELPGWRIDVDLVDDAAPVPATVWEQPVRLDATAGLVVGMRRPGDRIELAGMTGRRRLQDLFVDAGVPRRLRDRWPVLRTDRGVLWVPGLSRVAEWAAARGDGAARIRVGRVG